MKKTLLATALLLAATGAQSATMTTANFEMYDGTGGYVGGASDVVGTIDGSTWSVSSATPFFGQLWTAHDGVILGEGTYSIDTVEGTPLNFTVGAGQVGGHILFDWGVTSDIDVVNVWDVSGDTYTSTDVDGDGVLGLGMTDGAFVGFNANFNFTAPAEVPVPAAVWLFGSGLVGLAGIARRRKTA